MLRPAEWGEERITKTKTAKEGYLQDSVQWRAFLFVPRSRSKHLAGLKPERTALRKKLGDILQTYIPQPTRSTLTPSFGTIGNVELSNKEGKPISLVLCRAHTHPLSCPLPPCVSPGQDDSAGRTGDKDASQWWWRERAPEQQDLAY
jgi:hypothetical protein